MGLREKVTLVLIAVALYETVCLCAAQSLNENPFEKYLSKLKLGKNRLNSKYDSGKELKYPRFQNELPDKNMYKTHSDYTSDTSSRIPSYVQSTGYDSSGKTSAISSSRDSDSLKKFRKEKRKKRKNSPSTQTYTRDDMPVATVPESFHNHEPPFSLSENGLFPEVQYPLTASETWAPNYWNPSPTHNEAANEDAYFMRGDSLNQNKRLKKKDFKSFLQSSAKGSKSILNAKDEITKVSLLNNVNNGQNNNELNKIIISEKNQPTLLKTIESNKTVVLNKPQKKKQLKIKTKKRLQPATSKKNLNSPKKNMSESQLSLNQDRNSTNSSSPSIIDSVSTVIKIEQLNEAPLLCKLEGNITDTLIEKTPDICFPSLTDTHSTSALEDTFNSDLLSERNSTLLPITYLDTNFEVNNSSTIEAVVSDPTSKETLSNDWTKLELLLTDTDSKLPVEMHRKKPIKEFKALRRKKLKDYPGLLTDDSVRRRIFDILLTKKISVSSLKEKILKILQSEEQVSSDIVTEPQLTFIPQNVIQNIPGFSIANNTLKCNVAKATDNDKPCVDDDIYESKLHINLSNDDMLEILTSVKAISNLESVVAKKTDTFEEVIPETSSTNTSVDNIVEIISHAIACNDTCAVILNTSVVNNLNDLNLVPEKTKIISESSVEVVPKVSENSFDVISLPIVTEALSDNLRDVISNPSSSRVFIDDLREMIRLLTIWNSQFNETDEKILDSIVEDKTNTDLVNPAATINNIKHDAKTSENLSNLNISYELTPNLGVVISKTAATDNGIPQSSRIDTSEIIDDVIKEDNNKLAQKPTSNFSVISFDSLADDNTDFTEKPAIYFGENVDDALSENLAVDSSEMILNFTADDNITITEIPTVEVGKTPVKYISNSYDTPTKSPSSNLQEIILETLSAGTNREILNTVIVNHTINDTVPMIESWSSVPQAFTSSDMVLSLANEKEYNVSPTSFTRNNIPIPNTDKVTKQLTETNSSKTMYEPLPNNQITKATLNENFTAGYGKTDKRITNHLITKDHSEPDIYYVGLTGNSSISDLLSNKTIAYDYSKTVLKNSSKKIGSQFSSDITSDDSGDLNSNYTMYDSLTDTTSTQENPSPLSDIFPSLTEENESEFPIPYNKTLFSIQNKSDTTQFLSNIVQTGDENSSLNVCPITEETSFKNQCHWSDNLDDATSNFTDIMAGKLQLNSDIEPIELSDISLIDLVMGYAPNSTPEAQFEITSLPTVCNIDALLYDDEIPDFSDYTLSREDDTTADIIDNTVFNNISYFDQFAYSLSLLNDLYYNIFKEAQSTSYIIRTSDFDDRDFTVEKDLTSKPKETYLDSSNTTDIILPGPDSVTTNKPENELNPHNITDAETNEFIGDLSSGEHNNTLTGNTFIKSSSDDTTTTLTDFDNEALSEEEPDKSNMSNVNDTVQVKPITDKALNTLETRTATSDTRIPDFDDGDSAVEYELTPKPFIHTQPSDLISKENAAVINNTAFNFVESSSANETVFTYGLENHDETDTFDKVTSLITPNEDTANTDLNKPDDNLLMNYFDTIEANAADETYEKILIEDITDSEKTSIETYLDSSNTTDMELVGPDSVTTNEPENELNPHNITHVETNETIADFSSQEHDNTLANDTFIKSSSDHTIANLTDFENESLSEEEPDQSNVDNASVNNTKQVKPITAIELNTLETATTTSHTRIPDFDDGDFAVEYELTSKPFIYKEPSDLISKENSAVINNTAFNFVESLSTNETAFTYLYENSVPKEVFAEVMPEYEASTNLTDFTLANAFATSDEMSRELDSNESTLVPDDYLDEFANHSENDTIDQLSSLITPDEDTVDTDKTKDNFTLAEDLTDSEKTSIEKYLDSSDATNMVLPGPDSVTTNEPKNKLNSHSITDAKTYDILTYFSSAEHDNTLADDTFTKSSSGNTTDTLKDLKNEPLSEEEPDKSNVGNASVNNTVQVKPINDIELNKLETATTSLKRIPNFDDRDFAVEYELTSKPFIYKEPSDLISKENSAVINNTAFNFVESLSANETAITYLYENSVPKEVFVEVMPEYEASTNLTDFTLANAFATSDEMSRELDSNEPILVPDDYVDEFANHNENYTFDRLTSLITPNEDTVDTDLNKPANNLMMNYFDTIEANAADETNKNLTLIEDITDSEKTSIETYLDSSNTTDMELVGPDSVTTNEPENELNPHNITHVETNETIADFSSQEHDNTLANDTFIKSSSDHTIANLTDFENESLSEEEPDQSNVDNASVNNTKQVKPITAIELNTLETATTTPHTRIPDFDDGDFAVEYELTSKPFIYKEPSDLISKENSAVINNTAFNFVESLSTNETAFTYLYENSVPKEVFAEVMPEYEASTNLTDFTLANAFATSDEMSRELDSNESTLVPDDYLDEFANHSENDTIDQLSSLITPDEDTVDTDKTKDNFTLAEDLTDSEKTSIEKYLDSSDATNMVLPGPDSVTTNEPKNKLNSHSITDAKTYDILTYFSSAEHDNTLADDTFTKSSSSNTTDTLKDLKNEPLSEEEPDKSNVGNASVNNTVQVKPINDIELNKLETATTSLKIIPNFDDRDFAVEYELTSKPFIYKEPSDLISKENSAVINNTAFNFVESLSANETAFTYLYENSVPKEVFVEVMPEYEASTNLTDFTLANAFATSDEMSRELDSNEPILVPDDYVDEFANHNENDTFDQLTSLITPDEDIADTDLNKPVDNSMMNYFDTIEANVADETNKNLTLIEDITDSDKTSIEKYLGFSNTTDILLAGPDSVTTNEPENEFNPHNITDAKTNDIIANLSSGEHINTQTDNTFIKSSSDDTITTLTDFDNESLSEEEPDKQTDSDFAVEYELTSKPFIYKEPSDLISKENSAVINNTAFNFVESLSANKTAFTYLYENSVPKEVFAEVMPEYEASTNLTDFTLANAFATSDEMSRELDSNGAILVPDDYVDEFGNHNKTDTFDQLTSLITSDEDTADNIFNKPKENLLINYFDTIEANVADETDTNITLIEGKTESEKISIETYLESSNITDMGLSGLDSLTTNDPKNKLKPHSIIDAETNDIIADLSSEEHINTLVDDTFINSSSDDTTSTLTDFDNKPLSEEEPDIQTDRDFAVEYELTSKPFIYKEPSDLISKENSAVINNTAFNFVESLSANETAFTYLYENSVPKEVFAKVMPEYEASTNLTDFTLANAFATSDEMSKEVDSNEPILVPDDYVDELTNHYENDTFDFISLITPNEGTADTDLSKPVDNLWMNYFYTIETNVADETNKNLTLIEDITDSEKTSIETYLDSSNTTDIGLSRPDSLTTNAPENELKPQNITDGVTHDIIADFSSEEHDYTLANETIKSSSDDTTAILTDFNNKSLSEEQPDQSNADNASLNKTVLVKPIADIELNKFEINHTMFDEVATDQSGSNDELTDNNDLDSNTDLQPIYTYEQEVADSKDYQMTRKLLDGQDITVDLDDSDRFDTG